MSNAGKTRSGIGIGATDASSARRVAYGAWLKFLTTTTNCVSLMLFTDTSRLGSLPLCPVIPL